MGQPITVVEKRSSNPSILRMETNRPLSGLGHERYTEAPPEYLDRPVDEAARRLFAHGGVSAVHINGSVITVTLSGGSTGEGLADIVRGLFLHYGPTPDEAPATDEAPAEDAPAAAEAPAADEAPAEPAEEAPAEPAEAPSGDES